VRLKAHQIGFSRPGLPRSTEEGGAIRVPEGPSRGINLVLLSSISMGLQAHQNTGSRSSRAYRRAMGRGPEEVPVAEAEAIIACAKVLRSFTVEYMPLTRRT
jgi:hypothetical protein